MRRVRWIALVLLAPLAVACAPADEADEDTLETEETAEEMTDRGAAMAGTSVALAPKNESDLSGTAVLKPGAGDSLTVELRLSGLTEGESYPAHIHEGTCQSPGPVATGLESVTAEGTTGQSTSRVVDPRAGDAEGAFLVMAHQPDGTPASCGDIPTRQEPPTGGE